MDAGEETGEEIDGELLAMFLDDTEDGLAEADGLLARLAEGEAPEAPVAAVFRIAHTIKGVAGFIPLPAVVELTHHLEGMLDAVRRGRLPVEPSLLNVLNAGFDQLRAFVARIRGGEALPLADTPGLPELLAQIEEVQGGARAPDGDGDASVDGGLPLGCPQPRPGEPPVEGDALEYHGQGTHGDSPSATTPSTATAAPPLVVSGARRSGPARSMRIDEDKVDEFLAYVSEFIVLREMFDHVGMRLRADFGMTPAMKDFERARQTLVELSSELQRCIMGVRRVPARCLLQKVPRIVREVAQSTGKVVRLRTSGEELPVDKSLLQLLEAPLVHIVRNAVDHGIEPAALRVQRGKSAGATVSVEALEAPGEVRLRVRDDGGGIDPVALRERAVKMGILPAERAEQLSDEASYPLLFAPGLSTAKAVTDISGRGVGMDVVHRAVTDAGGRIEVASQAGKGTTFTICLPSSVTVQIMDGFVVAAGGQRYVLPVRSVQECFQLRSDDLEHLAGGTVGVLRGGRVIILRALAGLLERGRCERSLSAGQTVVALGLPGGGRAGVVVDAAMGVQQVVLREVPYLQDFDTAFSGGVVLGDGSVAMMLDIGRLLVCLSAASEEGRAHGDTRAA